ncbi:hypothetical protein BsWGS_00800 [Bradybaena similaris]
MRALRRWLKGPNASIYCCHCLASWSGRMWAFSMGLFLISVSPESLHLSATYGLCMGAAVLVFGAIIGDWVDKTARLKAATLAMIFQNVLIAVCACVILTLILLLSNLGEVQDWLRRLFYAIIISLSVCSRLMKEARIIVVERDWIVEMCAKDEHQLAVMTSSFRRLDLVTKLLAPVVTGQIMTFAGLKIGCGFVAGWSLASLFIEYYLIKRVYNIVPALKTTKLPGSFEVTYESAVRENAEGGTYLMTQNAVSPTAPPADQTERVTIKSTDTAPHRTRCILFKMASSFLILYRGLTTYFSCITKWPGLALACLYLTVLGFDDITVGYATMLGFSGSILGIMMGIGAGFGILATFTYPCIVQKLGLPKSGVLALGLQVTCLTLCIVSVWLPDSPFDLSNNNKITIENGTLQKCNSGLLNETRENVNVTSGTTLCLIDRPTAALDSNFSVWVLLAGIVLARFGLWTADLTTIQLFLENVPPKQRGIVNGFQSSLNQLMDFLKYALVVVIPHARQFGILVFISYSFICLGWMFMCVNVIKTAARTKRREDTEKTESIGR